VTIARSLQRRGQLGEPRVHGEGGTKAPTRRRITVTGPPPTSTVPEADEKDHRNQDAAVLKPGLVLAYASPA